MTQKNLIIVFTKPLERGKVKKRIAEVIGSIKALELYKMLLNKTLATIERSGFPLQFYLTEIMDSETLTEFKLQDGKNLGERMSKAIAEELRNGNQVCLIGGDCLDIDSSDLKEAFDNLKINDLVIGPSYDGGYYLIGMKKHYPELFTSIQWSTATVFEETLKIAQRLNLSIHILPQRLDIDHVEDIPKNWLNKLNN